MKQLKNWKLKSYDNGQGKWFGNIRDGSQRRGWFWEPSECHAIMHNSSHGRSLGVGGRGRVELKSRTIMKIWNLKENKI